GDLSAIALHSCSRAPAESHHGTRRPRPGGRAVRSPACSSLPARSEVATSPICKTFHAGLRQEQHVIAVRRAHGGTPAALQPSTTASQCTLPRSRDTEKARLTLYGVWIPHLSRDPS